MKIFSNYVMFTEDGAISVLSLLPNKYYAGVRLYTIITIKFAKIMQNI